MKNDYLIDEILKDKNIWVEEDTGKIFNKRSQQGHVTNTWREVGNVNSSGFLKFKYKRTDIFVHRLVYKKANGKLDPDLNVTHINGDKTDCKKVNLEQCTQRESLFHRFDEKRYNNPACSPKHREEERLRATELRKKGMSYKQILKEVNVSKSSLSVWLRDIKLTKKQQEQIDNRKKTENNCWRNKEQPSSL